jgi:integrase
VNVYLDHGRPGRFLLKLVDLWGDLPLNKLDQQEVDRAARVLYPNGSTATLVRQVYGPVSAVLHHAVDCGLEGVSVRRIKFPKLDKRKVTVWATDEYIAQLLPHCGPALRAAVLVMTYTGLRTGEVLGLGAGAFRVEAGMVLVPKTKNGEAAFVPLPPAALDAVEAVLPRSGTPWPWTSPQGFRRALVSACARAQVEYLSPHKIGRHAFAARLLRAGYDIKTVKEAGRWKKLQVVDESYGHLEQRAAHRAMLEVANAENLRTPVSHVSMDEGERIVFPAKKEAARL